MTPQSLPSWLFPLHSMQRCELVIALQVILMAGLQGVGKTTACGKLALALKKQKRKVLMVATDVYRPAAIDQLVKLGEQVGVKVFEQGTNAKPAEIAAAGLQVVSHSAIAWPVRSAAMWVSASFVKLRFVGAAAASHCRPWRLGVDASLPVDLGCLQAFAFPSLTLQPCLACLAYRRSREATTQSLWTQRGACRSMTG